MENPKQDIIILNSKEKPKRIYLFLFWKFARHSQVKTLKFERNSGRERKKFKKLKLLVGGNTRRNIKKSSF